MGRLVLQMMISVDGMVSGLKGELDWIAGDAQIEEEHLARLKEAKVVVMGAGLYPDMPNYWAGAANDETLSEAMRGTGRAMTETSIAVYSHEEVTVKDKDTLHVATNDKEFADDINRLKQETDGLLVAYGGVRLARSLIQQGLVDEIHLDVCPIILGEGQPLFTDLKQRTNLRLLDSVSTSLVLRYCTMK